VVFAAGCQVQGGVRPGAAGTLPENIDQFGPIRLANADEARESISVDRAVQLARDEGYQWPNTPSTYLLMADSLTPDQSADSSRLVWLVMWDNVNVQERAPSNEEGEGKLQPPYQLLYVFLDARSGDFIKARFTE
jgi:hypothetical protein